MPTYSSPGVYIREISSGTKPISSASTSTGAFIGLAQRGAPYKATFIANWTSFTKEFGSFTPYSRLAYSVYSFFQEGGSSCYVVAVEPKNSVDARVKIPGEKGAGGEGGEGGEGAQAAKELFKVVASSKGAWGNHIKIEIKDPIDEELVKTHFTMIVHYEEPFSAQYQDYRDGDVIRETYANMTLRAIVDKEGKPIRDDKNQIVFKDESRINGDAQGEGASTLIRVDINDDAVGKRPPNGIYTLEKGSDGDLSDADYNKGIDALDAVDQILMIAVPDKAGDREVTIKGLSYCKKRTDCFFIADPPHSFSPSQVLQYKKGNGADIPKEMKGSAFNSDYGAMYYPWVYITDPLTGRRKLVPPSGIVAGIYAYTDTIRGVHKAPAGTGVGHLKTIVGMERSTFKSEHDLLHPNSINVIRTIGSSGDCIWGASTLSSDPEWKYINIRRLFIMIRVSIYRATQWTVFEPNDPILWGKVNRNITAYLMGIWRSGALVGSSPPEAFFVKVDAENNPQDAIDRGELHIDIGIAPVKPAEFVIFTIRQKAPSE